ncbi:MAG: phage major capsid protein [Chloroflexi bacterium]|nr:phage major capsid protein [Chloroflexota bacterium]
MCYNNIIDRSSDAAALIPEEVAASIIQGVPQNSAALRLARRVTMSRSQQRMPCLSALPTAYWVNGDTGLKQTTEQAWSNKYLNAEELAVIVPIPQAVLDDSEFDIWGEVRPRLVEAFGVAIDGAVFYGTNKPASWPNDIYAGAVAASHNVSLAAFADIADALGSESGVMAKVEDDGFNVGGFVAAMSVKAKLRGLRDANGGLIFQPSLQAGTPSSLYGQPLEFPMNGVMDDSVTSVFAGDWSNVMMAVRQDITFKILDQAVIQDGAGNIVYNLAQQDMVALRAVMRVAYQIANPINRMNATEATRYPFAGLVAVGFTSDGSPL